MIKKLINWILLRFGKTIVHVAWENKYQKKSVVKFFDNVLEITERKFLNNENDYLRDKKSGVYAPDPYKNIWLNAQTGNEVIKIIFNEEEMAIRCLMARAEFWWWSKKPKQTMLNLRKIWVFKDPIE